MSQVANYFNKRTGWQRLYDWDFAQFDEFISLGETGIVSASYTFVGNVDNNFTIISQAVSGYRVQLLVAGGTPGATYTVTVNIVTSPTGYKLNWDGIFKILP